jgi:hypothetical protein
MKEQYFIAVVSLYHQYFRNKLEKYTKIEALEESLTNNFELFTEVFVKILFNLGHAPEIVGGIRFKSLDKEDKYVTLEYLPCKALTDLFLSSTISKAYYISNIKKLNTIINNE